MESRRNFLQVLAGLVLSIPFVSKLRAVSVPVPPEMIEDEWTAWEPFRPLGGVFTFDNAKLETPFGSALLQSVQLTSSQSTSRRRNKKTAEVQYMGGRSSGQLTAQRMVGPSGPMAEIMSKYADITGPRPMFKISTTYISADGQAEMAYWLCHPVLVAVGLNIGIDTVAGEGPSMCIAEGVSFIFTTCDTNGPTTDAPGIIIGHTDGIERVDFVA